MVKVINELGFGGRLGASLGAGFSDALGQLAQHKIDTMKQDKEYQSIAKTIKQFNPYISDVEAYNIARVPEARKAFFERGITVSGGQDQEGQEEQPRTIQFGLSPKEKEAQLKRSEALSEKGLKAYGSAEHQAKAIDKALDLIKRARKETGYWGKPTSYSKNKYGDDVEKATNDPIIQELGSLYQSIANEETLKNLAESGSRAGQAFAAAAQKAKANVFQDYDAQEAILRNLKENLAPVLKEGRVLDDIIKKNKGNIPLDLAERMNKALSSQIYNEEVKAVDQQVKQDVSLNELPEGSQIERNGKIEEKRNGKWVVVG